ncbi:unnamed protein product [Blepharisma stoltei]|uniref:Palmitoyltransferase n=1 Tax=Blepharisma stoltei TaxID=1481888 RepID=A0AAU9IET5_9CILI|nr:unnamed protein product [Blepharisma stoltei]
MSESQAFISSIYKADISEIYRVLRRTGIFPHKCKDSRGYTALHIASINSNYAVMEFLVDYIRRTYGLEAPKILKAWANEKTSDGFLPLHFASFSGHLRIIKLLIEIGSELHVKNNQGLTLMHVTAQGDQPLVLAYYRELGLNIDDIDEKGGTPLHWACYMGCETAASLLLAWGADPSKQDSEGHTPLHLATTANNTRIIRNLLLKGSIRNIKDKKGRYPIDIANEGKQKSSIKLLRPIGIFSECGVKPPLRPPKKSYSSLLVFLLVFIGGNLLKIFIVDEYVGKGLRITYSLLIIFVSICFFITWLKDPGYIKPGENESIFHLYEQYETHLICPDCAVYRPARSRHCQTCNKCVEKFDHHCPWINNCIGAKNIGVFYIFICSIWISLIFAISLSLKVLIDPELDAHAFDVALETSVAFSVITIIIASAFMMPVTFLVSVQTKNFWTNRTTSERFSKPMKSKESASSTVSFLSIDQNGFKNCWEMLCNKGVSSRVSHEFRPHEDHEISFLDIVKNYEKEYGDSKV